MRIYQRVGRNTAIGYSLWPIVFVGFFVISGLGLLAVRYPWVSLAVLICVPLACARAYYERHDVWPWQPRPNPEFDLNPEPVHVDAFVTDVLKPYREKIRDTQR
jgi:hypothetical protein